MLLTMTTSIHYSCDLPGVLVRKQFKYLEKIFSRPDLRLIDQKIPSGQEVVRY